MRPPDTALVRRGHHVYAYCNIRTNQVLYSLTRFLEHGALEQLPDIGANNKPPALRKDSWRPLFTLTYPLTELGASQGLHAFESLRQWRSLHETSWTPTEELSRPYSDALIKELEDKREDRGGSKKETIYDYIKRQKKKLRAKIIMDQKANSIADLAKVLTAQKNMSRWHNKRWQSKQRHQMVRLARRAKDKDGLAKLAEEIKSLEAKISALRSRRQNVEKLQTRRRLHKVKQELRKMRFAIPIVEKAHHERLEAIARAAEAPAEAAQGQQEREREQIQEGEEQGSRKNEAVLLEPYLPLFPEELLMADNGLLSPYEREQRERKRSKDKTAAFSTKGIKVYWANIMDAEFAKKWPNLAQHEHMPLGTRRHGAAEPGGQLDNAQKPRANRILGLERALEQEVERRFQSWGEQKRNAPGARENLRASVRAQMGGKLRRVRRRAKLRFGRDLRAMKRKVWEEGAVEDGASPETDQVASTVTNAEQLNAAELDLPDSSQSTQMTDNITRKDKVTTSLGKFYPERLSRLAALSDVQSTILETIRTNAAQGWDKNGSRRKSQEKSKSNEVVAGLKDSSEHKESARI